MKVHQFNIIKIHNKKTCFIHSKVKIKLTKIVLSDKKIFKTNQYVFKIKTIFKEPIELNKRTAKLYMKCNRK